MAVTRKRKTAEGGTREKVTIAIHAIEIEAEVWRGMSGWSASALIESRDLRVFGAASREDAMTRLRQNISSDVEATAALGVKNRRYWSPNPYWKGD